MIKAEGLGYHSRKFKMQDVSFELEDGYILTLLGKMEQERQPYWICFTEY